MKDKLYKIKNEIQKEMENLNIDNVCFTGYRSQKLPWGFNNNDIRCIITKVNTYFKIKEAINLGKKHFISGMALGFDIMCAEIILQLKKKYKDLILQCSLPYKYQSSTWSLEEQKRHKKILSKADIVRCIFEDYVMKCMQERNCYMVNKSSLIIALFDGKTGGTKNTLEYAKSQNKEIWIINPRQSIELNAEDIDLLQRYLSEQFINKQDKKIIIEFLKQNCFTCDSKSSKISSKQIS